MDLPDGYPTVEESIIYLPYNDVTEAYKKLKVKYDADKPFDALLSPDGEYVREDREELRLTRGWIYVNKQWNDYASTPLTTGIKIIPVPIIVTDRVSAGATGSKFIVEIQPPEDGNTNYIDRAYYLTGDYTALKAHNHNDSVSVMQDQGDPEGNDYIEYVDGSAYPPSIKNRDGESAEAQARKAFVNKVSNLATQAGICCSTNSNGTQ
jgi:hypothetical protein